MNLNNKLYIKIFIKHDNMLRSTLIDYKNSIKSYITNFENFLI